MNVKTTNQTETPEQSNAIASVNDALHLLQVVAENPDCGLSELARLSGLNKSRVYRMLCTFMIKNFIQQNQQNGRYSLGFGALILGQAARSQVNLSKSADAIADDLMAEFNENLQLRIIEQGETVQIWRRLSSQSLQVRSSIGNRRELGAGASGKLLLAFANPNIQTPILEKQPHLLPIIQKIQTQKFAVSHGELTSDICAFAAPVFDANGECVACLSLSAPQSRTDDERAQQILNAICQSAKKMSLQLGFKG